MLHPRALLAALPFFVFAASPAWGAETPGKAAPRLPAPPAKTSPAPAAKAAPTPAPAAKAAPSAVRAADPNVRRAVAGGPTLEEASLGPDTPELRTLRSAEEELFRTAMPELGKPWPSELPSPSLRSLRTETQLPGAAPKPRAIGRTGKPVDPTKLTMPDLPVQWDARVVKYLEFFRDDPRGRSVLSLWLKRAGKYRDYVQAVLRRKGLPEDLFYLAMIESGFEPVARSPVGAAGMWQFMPETGRIYGLSQDRWIDARMNVELATEAAADYLADLYRRFGSWDLAMASYNMGYGGMMGSIKRFNTNDFWTLSRLESGLPWETTLYVPKILAIAIVAKNADLFGYRDVSPDAALSADHVLVPPGTALAALATCAAASAKDIADLNPEVRAGKTPPSGDYPLRVPAGKGAPCHESLSKGRGAPSAPKHTLKFGETLQGVADTHKTSLERVAQLNAIAPGERLHAGTTLFIPESGAAATTKDAKILSARPGVVLAGAVTAVPGRKRVFYRVQAGDVLSEIASAFTASSDEIVRWNAIDPRARLVEGMVLQIFAPSSAHLERATFLEEKDVALFRPGTPEFFEKTDEKGRIRKVVKAKAGQTLEAIGKELNVNSALMERINRRGRGEALRAGEDVVAYLVDPKKRVGGRPAISGEARGWPVTGTRFSEAFDDGHNPP